MNLLKKFLMILSCLLALNTAVWAEYPNPQLSNVPDDLMDAMVVLSDNKFQENANTKQQFEILRKYVEQNEPAAILWFAGIHMFKGEHKQTIALLERSIQLHNIADSKSVLGLYLLGEMPESGIQPDVPRGLKLLNEAAEQGHVSAYNLLAAIYMGDVNIGVPRDFQKAEFYLKKMISEGTEKEQQLGKEGLAYLQKLKQQQKK